MSRVLVVGPGPVRPGVGVGSSCLARDLAVFLGSAGHEIVAVDASPTSALLEPGLGASRYLEPLTATAIRAIAQASRAEAIVAEVMGIHVARTVGAELDDLVWLGSRPSALVLASPVARGAAPAIADGASVLDAVIASDGAQTEVLAVFDADVSAGRAPCDATHSFVEAPSSEVRALLSGLANQPRGLATVRVVDGSVAFVESLESALVGWASEACGLRAGALLGALLAGASVDEALRDRSATAGRVRHHLRAPSFGRGAAESADRASSAAQSLGGRLIARSGSASPAGAPSPDAVFIAGPAPARPGHGEEASAASRRALRLAEGEGLTAHVLTTRADLGWGDALATSGDLGLQGSGYIHDFGEDGADTEAGAQSDPAAIELHVITITGGGIAKVLGTFEHVERGGVHASDAAAVFPSLSLPEDELREAEDAALEVARRSDVRGLLTARFAVLVGQARARTLLGVTRGVTTHVLSLEHVLGRDFVAEAYRVARGAPLDPEPPPLPRHVAVEEHVFPFAELGATDTKLGRVPHATGTVLGIAKTVGRAYAKALAAMGVALAAPAEGERSRVLLAGSSSHSVLLADLGRRLYSLGFDLVTTEEAATWLDKLRVPHQVEREPVRMIAAGRYHAIVAPGEGASLRRAALAAHVACFTTVELVEVAVRALEEGTARPPSSLATWNSSG